MDDTVWLYISCTFTEFLAKNCSLLCFITLMFLEEVRTSTALQNNYGLRCIFERSLCIDSEIVTLSFSKRILQYFFAILFCICTGQKKRRIWLKKYDFSECGTQFIQPVNHTGPYWWPGVFIMTCFSKKNVNIRSIFCSKGD